MEKIGLIVTSSSELDLSYFNQKKFIIIGVERGCLELIRQKIKIDYALADFDQVSDEEFSKIEKYAQQTIVLKKTKDELDGIAAVKFLQNLGIQKIKFLTKASSRYDMDLSIFELIKNYSVEIFNEKTHIYKIPSGLHKLNFEQSRFISFYTLVDHNQITLKNLRYETKNLSCELFSTRFISNEFLPDIDPTIECLYPVMAIVTK